MFIEIKFKKICRSEFTPLITETAIIYCRTPNGRKTFLFKEAFVVFHHYLRFESRIEFESDRYADYKARCAEYRRRARIDKSEDYRGNECDKREEYCAEKRYPVLDPLKIFRSGFPGTNAENETAVLLNGLGDVFGVELYLRIEERKCKYQQCENDHIKPRTRTHIALPPDVSGAARPEHRHDHFGEGQNGECEYKGHNAVRIDLDGDNGRLTAVHLSAFDLLGVLNGNSSFGKFHPDDKPENDNDRDNVTDYCPELIEVETLRHERDDRIEESVARRCEDTYEDEKRNTVGNAVFGDPFAYPYGNERARRVESDDDDISKPYLIEEYLAQSKMTFGVNDIGVERYEDTDSLDYSKYQRAVSRQFGYLFLTFFALLAHSFECGDSYGQKLQNYRSVDVRADTHSEPGAVCKRATGHHTHNAQVRRGRDPFGKAAGTYAGNGDIAPYSVNQDEKKSHPDLDPDFFYLKGIF